MLAVHFGAGNIGRGFIGQLLHEADYEVIFVDVNQELVDAINSRKAYAVQLAMEGYPVSVVEGVRAIHGQDTTAVARAIAEADLVTTAVGPHVLPHIASAIAAGIAQRIKQTDRPLNVIACENMIGGSSQLKTHVFAQLSEDDRTKAEKLVGFPDSAVDRIVPLQKHDDQLRVTVEPFFEWVVDQSHIIGDIPQIEGITYVNDLTPYIERKLYTVNTGHAMIAYLGYQKEYATIDQAVMNEEILRATRQASTKVAASASETSETTSSSRAGFRMVTTPPGAPRTGSPPMSDARLLMTALHATREAPDPEPSSGRGQQARRSAVAARG